jgi:predicted acylesterase/phospholipase RssA
MSQQTTEQHEFSPFQSIALCFSGGGFRAAAFSLGVLSYLNKVKITDVEGETSLLSHVNFIASASGGTITNLLYSSYLFKYNDESEAYRRCYTKLYNDMKGEALLEKATGLLANPDMWNEPGNSKQRNVINAFSRVYDMELFDGETFDIFWKGSPKRDFSVCLNATEFTRGISFRFQHESNPSLFSYAGNNYIHFDRDKKEVMGKVKLADILAASSCFPSGFEPIIFPEDFAYMDNSTSKSLTVEELKSSVRLKDYNNVENPITESIGLMDGGVTDNQALYSAMYADDRRRNKGLRPFDLIMINDVTSYFMKPYEVKARGYTSSAEKNLNYYLNKITGFVKWIKWIQVIFISILLLSVAGIILLVSPWVDSLLYFLFGFSVLGVGVMAGLQYFINLHPEMKEYLSENRDEAIKKLIDEKSEVKFSDSVISNLLAFLKETKLSNLRQMIMSRVNSVITMTVEVNLKQVRRLIYSLFYENQIWDNRRASSFIYELSPKNEASRREKFASAKEPDPSFYLTKADKELLLDLKTRIPEIADAASKMGTTLWFVEEEVKSQIMDKIIQCGQFTACANLLEYALTLIRQEEASKLNFDDQTLNRLKAVKDILESDWNEFRDQPDFYFKEEMAHV